MGPVEILLTELLTMKVPAQVVAIAGKSEELKVKLERLAKKVPGESLVKVIPIGFTKQMDEYMAAADLLISKPGGLTTSEAMARELPMCVVNPIPGQEERNSDHLLEAVVAIKCNNPPTLGWKVEELIKVPGRLEGDERAGAGVWEGVGGADDCGGVAERKHEETQKHETTKRGEMGGWCFGLILQTAMCW